MPIRKFHSVAEMPSALVRERLDPRNLELACELSVLAAQFARRRFPAGVHRYRSPAEATAQRDIWERQPPIER